MRLTIYGNLLISEKIEELDVNINLSDFSPGIYFLVLRETNFKLIKK